MQNKGIRQSETHKGKTESRDTSLHNTRLCNRGSRVRSQGDRRRNHRHHTKIKNKQMRAQWHNAEIAQNRSHQRRHKQITHG